MAANGKVRQKVYVEVVALHHKDGVCDPMFVTYKDGRTFRVDRVLDRRRAAACHTGAVGLRYAVEIGSARTFLYYENPRWFVEGVVNVLDK